MSRTGATAGARGRRLDIQGLRGLPVIPTLIYHMVNVQVISGGVIFLDMFFTVSGFLITVRLIQLAQTRDVRTYYYEFYKFRVRRLFPAAIFTIVVTAVLARLLMVPSRAEHVRGDAFSALFFFANVHFGAQGTDYMHRTSSTSPLLPFWSLSVEEQFYVVWPIVLLIVISLAAARPRLRRRLAIACVAIAVLSFGYGLWFTHAHRIAAYYDTFSRAWDFAVGALLAVYAARRRLRDPADGTGGATRSSAGSALRGLRDVLNRHARTVAWAGVLCFVVGTFTTPTNDGFPVPWAGVGVFGAALVIYAGIDQGPPNWLLNSRVMVWLGDVSYSFYVVHFPVMIFAALYLSGNRALLYTFDVVATACATVLVYYFIEEPGRRGFTATWAWLRAGRHRSVLNVAALTGTVATILFAVGFQAAQQPAPVEAASAAPAGPATPASVASSPPSSWSPDPASRVVPLPALQESLTTALTATSWSEVSNADRIDDPGSYLGACWYDDPARLPCVARPAGGTDPAKVAVAVGDSTMVAYWPMLRAALVPRGWTVVMFAQRDCPAVVVDLPAGAGTQCRDYYAAYPRVLDTWRPALVLMANSEYDLLGIASEEGGQAVNARVEATYAAALRATVASIQRRGSAAVVVSPPPVVGPAQVPGTCIARGAPAQSCTYTPAESWFALDDVNRAAAAASGATYAETESLFCVALRCPGVVGGLVVHADRNHITPEYATAVAPSFARFLVQRGLVR